MESTAILGGLLAIAVAWSVIDVFRQDGPADDEHARLVVDDEYWEMVARSGLSEYFVLRTRPRAEVRRYDADDLRVRRACAALIWVGLMSVVYGAIQLALG